MAIRGLLGLLILGLYVPAASAQVNVRVDVAPPGKRVQEGEKVQTPAIYRVSTIKDMDVRNAAGEELGNIKELVIDITNGKVRYAALSFGGFLGLGDKLFAVPWNALTIKHDPEESFFLLNVDVKRLEQAAGFDEDKWPNVGDPRWGESIDKLHAMPQASEVKTAPGKPAVEQKYATIYRTSDVVGMNVQNPAGEDLGSVNELVIDLNTGKVRYAAVSFGGFLGIGDKLFAVPWDAMQLKLDENDRFFVMDVDKERLEKAPGFNENQWPNTADPRWGEGIDRFYQKQPAPGAAAQLR